MATLKKVSFQRAYDYSVRCVGKDYNIPLRVHQAIWCALNSLKLGSCFVELGCGKGFIFSAILAYLDEKNISHRANIIWLFDSFLPFKPDSASGRQIDRNQPHASVYADGPSQTIANFSRWSNVRIVEGDLPQSLISNIDKIDNVSFLHVDLNHYIPEIECLEVIWPKLSKTAFILLDDYANASREDQWLQHEKFFSTRGHEILTTASGQGIIFVNKRD